MKRLTVVLVVFLIALVSVEASALQQVPKVLFDGGYPMTGKNEVSAKGSLEVPMGWTVESSVILNVFSASPGGGEVFFDLGKADANNKWGLITVKNIKPGGEYYIVASVNMKDTDGKIRNFSSVVVKKIVEE